MLRPATTRPVASRAPTDWLGRVAVAQVVNLRLAAERWGKNRKLTTCATRSRSSLMTEQSLAWPHEKSAVGFSIHRTTYVFPQPANGSSCSLFVTGYYLICRNWSGPSGTLANQDLH